MKKIMISLLLLISFFYSQKVFSQPGLGDAAPVITDLKLIDKEMPDLKNKFIYLHFWASWSGSEDIILKHLDVLAERYKNKVVFLAISEQNEEQVRSFLQGKQWYNICFALDDGQIKKKYSVSDLPRYFFISPKNIVLATGGFTSEISDHDLDSLIIINDSTVLPNTTNIVTKQDSILSIASAKIINKHWPIPSLMENMYSFDVNDEVRSVLANPKDIRRNDTN
jgi:thiol-disulfide isomerase/thioredoxin